MRHFTSGGGLHKCFSQFALFVSSLFMFVMTSMIMLAIRLLRSFHASIVICAAAQRRRDRRLETGRTKSASSHAGSRIPRTSNYSHRTRGGSNHDLRRRLTVDLNQNKNQRKLKINQANYPSEISAAYADWAEENAQEFIASGDLNCW